jgi:sugar phosphate isomerase/epimerase
MKRKLSFLLLLILLPFMHGQAQTKYDDSSLDKLGWRLAIQAWSFKLFSLSESLDKINELGIKYIEMYPNQVIGGGIEGTTNFSMDVKTREKVKNLLAKKGVKAVSYGVVKAKTEAEWVQIFEFCAALGIETIVTEPEAKFIGLLETLCDKHKINLGIHNHPKPTPYWHPDFIKPLIAARTSRMGVTGDIGIGCAQDLIRLTASVSWKVVLYPFISKI